MSGFSQLYVVSGFSRTLVVGVRPLPDLIELYPDQTKGGMAGVASRLHATGDRIGMAIAKHQRSGRGDRGEVIPKDFSARFASSAFKRRIFHRLLSVRIMPVVQS